MTVLIIIIIIIIIIISVIKIVFDSTCVIFKIVQQRKHLSKYVNRNSRVSNHYSIVTVLRLISSNNSHTHAYIYIYIYIILKCVCSVFLVVLMLETNFVLLL